MERTDGVLEIKKKAVPNRKINAAIVIMSVLMTALIIMLVLQFIGRSDSENNESKSSQIPQETTDQVKEQTTSTMSNEIMTSTTVSETIHTGSLTTAISDAVQNTSDISESENVHDDNNNNSAVNFEELFMERFNGWGASHVLTDTLSFSENGCTFTSNVGTDKVNCTVSANADMTDFTLTIEPATEYTSYATAVYIPDIANEITYFVLDYRMSSNMRTEIGLMFENFESDGGFAENTLHCDISTQAHNGGSYPITMLTADGTVKIIDFDISKLYKAIDTTDNNTFGTLGYAPFEQFGLNKTDERSDIFSVGVIANLLLTGKHPSVQIYTKGCLGKLIRICTSIDP